ncbi:MAG: CDP-alcohol phosphatidyltransferase family protein [Bryobacteraceae bacterium]
MTRSLTPSIPALGQLPNLFSALRLLAAPLVVWLIYSKRFELALFLTVPIGLSDWADGYLARRLGNVSRLGTYLDPAADKVLLVAAFVTLGTIGAIPSALVMLVLGRDVVIVAGVVLLWKLRGRKEFTPLGIGKISTVFQIMTVLVVLVSLVAPLRLIQNVRLVCFYVTALFTISSGIAYVGKGIRMADSRTAGSAQNSP